MQQSDEKGDIMAQPDAHGERLMFELQARDAWNQRDYTRVQSLAEQAAAVARASEDEAGWWNATYMIGESLRKQGRMKDSQDISEMLEGHDLTRTSETLSAKVATLKSFALQGAGDLVHAVDSATKAVQHASVLADQNGIRIEAQNALIAALAESGRLDEAWEECLQLAKLLATEPNSQTSGLCYWAIGNVAFLLRNISDGVRYHQLAARTLSPSNDLDLWARFNRGSAQFRLNAGVTEPETLECIERAELASSIVGGTERDRLELSLTRAQWLVLTGQFDAAVELLESIVKLRQLLASHVAGQAHLLLGQALFARHGKTEAVANLEESERLFLQSGAQDRALTARTLIDQMGAPPQ